VAFTSGIPLSLYIHIPWCVEKCPYCDFNSHALGKKFKLSDHEDQYVESLFRDLEQTLPEIWGRSIDAIFIGGGTPSLFSGQAIDNLLSGIRARLMLKADIEITLESNPGTAEATNYQDYRQAGINRLSIGVQSFNNKHLQTLGRIHNAEEARQAFVMARDAGFKRINLDLMFALPNQSVTEAMDDLNQAIKLKPEHLSWYQLTIEPNTVFYRQPPNNLSTDELIWDIQSAGFKLLKNSGYHQYEISAWCKPKEESQHNLNYWTFGDYIGIGAGAHGKITNFSEQQIHRTRRKKQPHFWLDDSSPNTLASIEPILSNEIALEFMMNALRLNHGVETHHFIDRTGLAISTISQELFLAKQRGLLENRDDRIQPTEKGQLFLNDLLSLFMKDPEHQEVRQIIPIQTL